MVLNIEPFKRRWRAGGAALVLMAALGGSASASPSNAALMPWPEVLRPAANRDDVLALSGAFRPSFEGSPDARLERAVERFQTDVDRLTGGGAEGEGPPLLIKVKPVASASGSVAGEAYSLTVSAEGVQLEADSPDAVLRGLATLRQLIERRNGGFGLPHVSIDDAPRFAWRGLMIDTSRHFVELDTLKRQIDAMERVKMNVLHFHISDNEGFRVESLRYPKLNQLGSHGQYYTQAEIRDLVVYAADRGVRVVPEIDLPAHTGAIMTAYPELAANSFDPNNRISMFSAAMDPTKPETYAFIRGLLEEMSGLFPDPYFHIGGDEVPAAAWTGNPAIVRFMADNGYADTVALQDHFFKEVNAIVHGLGKTSIGWEEVARQAVDDDVVVQAWRSSQAVSHITAQNNRAVVSAGYYLDLLWAGLDHYERDPLDVDATPPDSPEKIIGPAPDTALSDDQRRLVLGGEAALWAETVTDEMVDHRLWPRAALMAERFWSPRDVRDPVDAMRRATVVQEGLRIQGLEDEANQRRMAARISPRDAQALQTLADVTMPVRNMGRLAEVFAAFRTGQPIRMPRLTAPVDIAGTDSLAVYRMSVWADAVAKGDEAAVAPLQAALSTYRDNHPRFLSAARGMARLQEAIPVSAEVAELATVGLEAMDMRARGAVPSPEWLSHARALIQKQQEAVEASSSSMKIIMGVPQPPALLLIGLTPVIETLVTSVEPK